MRASLVSATSLLALLLVDGAHEAHATVALNATLDEIPLVYLLGGSGTATATDQITVTGGSSRNHGSTLTISSPGSPFGLTPSSTTINGDPQTVNLTASFAFTSVTTGQISTTVTAQDSSSRFGTASIPLTLTASGVAPLQSVVGSPTQNVLVGTQGTTSITVSNIGNGNLYSKTATGANLTGIIGSASSVFSGAAKSFTLNDSNYGTGATTSVTQTYTYTPTVRGAASTTITTTFTDGVTSQNGGGAVSTNLTINGVAPVASLASSSANYFLVGTTGTATVTVSNVGDGNLSGQGSVSNLRGSIASTTGAFASTGKSISLTDGTSTTNTYTFAPTVAGQTVSQLVVASLSNGAPNGTNAASNQTVSLNGTGVAPVQSVSNTGTTYVRYGTTGTNTITVKNTGNGNLATGGPSSASNLNGSVSSATLASGVAAVASNASTFSLPDASSTTLAYSYTPTGRGTPAVNSTIGLVFSDGNANLSNTAQSVSSVFVNQGVGPVYSSSVSGSGSSVMPTPVANGSIGPAGQTINFGTLTFNQSQTVYLVLKNTSTDPGGALTDLTIESYSISGAGSYEFHPTLASGSIIQEGGQLLVPIVLTGTGGGALNSSLTIFTDESAALGGVGDTFTYALTAFAVPEPATIAVLGVGLAGLAGLRRRRKQVAA